VRIRGHETLIFDHQSPWRTGKKNDRMRWNSVAMEVQSADQAVGRAFISLLGQEHPDEREQERKDQKRNEPRRYATAHLGI
jgi:hypothetical protein